MVSDKIRYEMNERNRRREIEKVVRKVLKLVHSYDTIGKKEFEVILYKIIEHAHKNTGIAMEIITQKTDKILQDIPNEYGKLSEDIKSWEAMIVYLYAKYLNELGTL